MELEALIRSVDAAGGRAGVYAVYARSGEVLAEHAQSERFTLASAAKLPIARWAVELAERGEANWGYPVSGLELGVDHDWEELYPHIGGISTLPLRDAVEVMIACLSQPYAEAVVSTLGGWEKLRRWLDDNGYAVQVPPDPSEEQGNTITPVAAARLMREVALGYTANPIPWLPVVNGLLRQHWKVDDVPQYSVFNVQGGARGGGIDFGLLGNIHSERCVAYAVAIRSIPDDRIAAVYEELERVIRALHAEFAG